MNAARLALDNIERYGEYVAFRSDHRAILNTEQRLYACKLATVLTDHGIGPGDRVLMMLPNSPEALGAFYATWMIGAAVVPVPPQLTPREAGFVAAHAGARFGLTIPARAQVLADARVRRLLVLGECDIADAQDITPEVIRADSDERMAERKAGDMAMLLYTSGTTARPKGVILTHQNVIASSECCCRMNPGAERCTILQLLPLFHVYGVLMFNLGLAWGLTSVIVPGFDPVKVFQTIQDYRVSRLAVVPAMLVSMLTSPLREAYDTSSLRLVTSGGGPLPEELRVQFERAFGCRVNQGYGLSETMSVVSAYADTEAYRPGSSGHPMPLVDVMIVAEDGRPASTGHTGELCVRGPMVSPGYWNDPESTRQAFRDEWHLTGDVGYQDADGYLYIVERKKDVIIKGGENISPREIEEVLHRHPAVAEAAVIGIPDPKFVENICAVVVLKPDASATTDELRDYAAANLMRFKLPARIVIAPSLPKNSAGKILKRELRERLAQSALSA